MRFLDTTLPQLFRPNGYSVLNFNDSLVRAHDDFLHATVSTRSRMSTFVDGKPVFLLHLVLNSDSHNTQVTTRLVRLFPTIKLFYHLHYVQRMHKKIPFSRNLQWSEVNIWRHVFGVTYDYSFKCKLFGTFVEIRYRRNWKTCGFIIN